MSSEIPGKAGLGLDWTLLNIPLDDSGGEARANVRFSGGDIGRGVKAARKWELG